MLWQPSLDTKIKIADINTHAYVYKTVQEILDWMSANNLGDSFAIRSSGYEYGCSIFPFTKVSSVKTAYFADNSYIQYSTSSSGFIGTYGFNGRALIGTLGRFGRYALSSGSWTSLGSFEFMTKTVNNIEYAFFLLFSGSGYNNCSQYYGFYINDIDTFYVNGLLYQNEYHGGAGSGYIGNSLLSEKKMVGYNVPVSSDDGTKTESVQTFSYNAEPNVPKAGNGHARIKFLGTGPVNTFFKADFNTDGRDIVHYKDIDVTISKTDHNYESVSRIMKQGQCVDFLEDSIWNVSNGSLNVLSRVSSHGYNPIFFWGYDTSQINQNVFPQNCTVVIEAEILFTEPERALSRIIEFYANAHLDSSDPSFADNIAIVQVLLQDIPEDTWHNIRVELSIENGSLANAETKGYLDNEILPSGKVSSYSSKWVSIDIAGNKHFDCCGIAICLSYLPKIRKYTISYTT